MTAAPANSKHILLIADIPTDVDVLLDQLSEAGFEVAVAEDGEDGLEQSQYDPPNLILLDTGGVAHDFNKILTVILGNCSLILDQLEPGHPLRSDVEQIHSAAQRAAGLTRRCWPSAAGKCSSQKSSI